MDIATGMEMPTTSGRTRYPLFAFLVGINNYASPTFSRFTLKGAVADAQSFRDWLKWIGTPDNQIVLLTNKKATHAAITASLRKLANDNRIYRGDPIFIYFAGHGTELPAPSHWNWRSRDKKIQAIVPYDCDIVNPQTQERVAPITDIFLGALLGGIAVNKGNNITVVFDCCHAGSGTRSGSTLDDNLSSTARSVELRNRYFDQLEQQMSLISLKNVSSAFQEFEQSSLESHVLLAACSHREDAYENPVVGDIQTTKRGAFTTALLKFLYSQPLDSLRYSDILNGMEHIEKQNPQCEGNHTNRLLFNSRIIPSRRKLFPVSHQKPNGFNPGGYTIHAGTIHKITPSSKFSLFRKSDIDLAHRVGTLSIPINSLGHFHSDAQVDISPHIRDVQWPMIAVQTNVGRENPLRVYVPPHNGFSNIHRLLKQNHDLDDVSLVHNQREADILAEQVSQYKVDFTLYTIKHTNLPPHTWVQSIEFDASTPAQVAKILSGAAHFYRELKFTDQPVANTIEVIFHELIPYSSFVEEWGPANPCVNLYKDGVVSIPHNTNLRYGIQLVNRSRYDLYPKVFVFDNRSLEITSWVNSAVPHSAKYTYDPPLRMNDTFTIGYGDGGAPSFFCEIEEGYHKNVDYLKIYLTTEPVDLSYLEQSSPFSSSRTLKKSVSPPPERWIGITIPVIQERR